MCKDVSSCIFVIFFITLTAYIFLFKYRVYTKQSQFNVVSTCTVFYMIISLSVSTSGRNDDSNKTSAPTTVFL